MIGSDTWQASGGQSKTTSKPHWPQVASSMPNENLLGRLEDDGYFQWGFSCDYEVKAVLGEDGQHIVNGRVLNQIIGDMLTAKITRAVELAIREHTRAVVTIPSDKSEGL
jgi:hypothetical protein